MPTRIISLAGLRTGLRPSQGRGTAWLICSGGHKCERDLIAGAKHRGAAVAGIAGSRLGRGEEPHPKYRRVRSSESHLATLSAAHG